MQRNFETLKTTIYRDITNNSNVSLTPFVLSCLGQRSGTMTSKIAENKKALNRLIDCIDIRAIEKVLEKVDKKLLPSWYINKKYVIDYNDDLELDFIIIKD